MPECEGPGDAIARDCKWLWARRSLLGQVKPRVRQVSRPPTAARSCGCWATRARVSSGATARTRDRRQHGQRGLNTSLTDLSDSRVKTDCRADALAALRLLEAKKYSARTCTDLVGVHAAAADDGVLGELHHLLGDPSCCLRSLC